MQNQTKRERNYYPFQSTNICLIYICTHECDSMWLHTTSLEVSTWCGCQSYTKWTLRVFAPCLQLPSPCRSITHLKRNERLGGSVGRAPRIRCQPWSQLQTPFNPPPLMPSQHLLVCAHLCDGTGRSLSTVSPTSCTFFKKVLKNIEMFPQCTTLAWKHQPSDEWVPDLVWEMAGARCGSAETKYTCLWIAFSFFLFFNKQTSSSLNVFQTYLLSWVLALYFVSHYKALLMFC